MYTMSEIDYCNEYVKKYFLDKNLRKRRVFLSLNNIALSELQKKYANQLIPPPSGCSNKLSCSGCLRESYRKFSVIVFILHLI